MFKRVVQRRPESHLASKPHREPFGQQAPESFRMSFQKFPESHLDSKPQIRNCVKYNFLSISLRKLSISLRKLHEIHGFLSIGLKKASVSLRKLRKKRKLF